jgi:hypothetical protein
MLFTTRDAFSTALKLTGISFILQSIITVIPVITAFPNLLKRPLAAFPGKETSWHIYLFLLALQGGLLLIFGFFSLLQSGKIAKIILPNEQFPSLIKLNQMESRSIFSLSLRTAGLVLLFQEITLFLRGLPPFILTSQWSTVRVFFHPDPIALISQAISILVAFGLIIKPQPLVNLIFRK